jgi:prepilin-type N-terminal cleavage/methylation domain-containing protein
VIKNKGFSLIEVMMAAGLLTIGFAFIAGVFPVGIKLVASSVENSMAPVIEQEAINKIKLYGLRVMPPATMHLPYDQVYVDVDDDDISDAIASTAFNDVEYDYPSTAMVVNKNYCWSAICRYDSGTKVEVTTFVCRKAVGVRYRNPSDFYNETVFIDRPQPIRMLLVFDPTDGMDVLGRIVPTGESFLIQEGDKIVDDSTGDIYTIVDRVVDVDTGVVNFTLDRDWGSPSADVRSFLFWFVPPAFGSSNNPCMEVRNHDVTF